jgi:hypothetical protein
MGTNVPKLGTSVPKRGTMLIYQSVINQNLSAKRRLFIHDCRQKCQNQYISECVKIHPVKRSSYHETAKPGIASFLVIMLMSAKKRQNNIIKSSPLEFANHVTKSLNGAKRKAPRNFPFVITVVPYAVIVISILTSAIGCSSI